MKNFFLNYKKKIFSYNIIFFMIILVPNCFIALQYNLSESERLLLVEASRIEYISVSRSYIIIFFAIIAFIAFIMESVKKNVVNIKRNIYIFCIFLTLFFISTFFSNYPSVAFFGIYSRRIGLIAYIAFLIVAYIVLSYSNKTCFINNLRKSVVISGIIQSVFVIFEYFGVLITTYKPLSFLYFSQIGGTDETIINRVVQGLTNGSNHLAFLMLIYSTVAIYSILTSNNTFKKTVYTLISTLFLFCLLATSTESALYGLAFVFSGIFFFKGKDVLKDKRHFLLLLLLVIFEIIILKRAGLIDIKRQAVFYLLIVVGSILSFNIAKIPNIEKYSKVIVLFIMLIIISIPVIVLIALKEPSRDIGIEYFKMDNNIISFKQNNMLEPINIQFEKDYFVFNNRDKKSIKWDKQSQRYIYHEKDYILDFSIIIPELPNSYVIIINNYQAIIKYQDNQLTLLNRDAHPTTLEQSDKRVKFLYDNKDQFSCRGFIWAYVIPMTYTKPIFGYGPDTLALEFSANSIEKYNGLYVPKATVASPHNIYLDFILNFGYPAFLMVMVLIYNAIVKGFKRKNEADVLAILVIVGVLAMGMFSDFQLETLLLFATAIGVLLRDVQYESLFEDQI